MDFSVSEPMQALVKDLRAFVDAELVPLEPRFGKEPFRDLLPVLREKRRLVKDNGWWAPHLPKDLGGMGLPLMDFALVSEVLGRTPIGHYVFNAQAPDVGNMELLHAFGTDEQKERWLKPLAAGDIRSCFAMTEPEHAGSNPAWMSATAVKDGDDYVLNGHKWFTSSADGAAFTIFMGLTNPEQENKYLRASQIIVPMDAPGVTLVRNISVMGHEGGDYASHAEVRFDNVRVPQTNLLGNEGAGFMLAQERLGPGRIHHCMRWMGICARAFDMMCAHAATRELSPEKPLATRQIVQQWIALSRAEIESTRLMILQTAWLIDHIGQAKAREHVHMIKYHAAQTLQRVLDRAVQTHGALGMTDDTPLAYWYSHERAARIYDGPDEVHQMVVAREALKPHGLRLR